MKNKTFLKKLGSLFIFSALFLNFYLLDVDISNLYTSVTSITDTKKADYKLAKSLKKKIYINLKMITKMANFDKINNQLKDLSFCDVKKITDGQITEDTEKKEEKLIYKGELIKPVIETPVYPGEVFQVKIYVRNKGNTRWVSDKSGCKDTLPVRIGTKREQDRKNIFYSDVQGVNSGWILGEHRNRVEMLQNYIDPNETAIFSFWSKAPEKTGIYREYFQPLIDGMFWFDNSEFSIDIPIGDVSEEEYKKLQMVGKSLNSADLQGEKNVEIDLGDQKIYPKIGDTVINEFRISSGARKTPTPTGNFEIRFKQDLRRGATPPHYLMPKFQAFARYPGGIWTGTGFHALPSLGNDGGVFWTEALSHIGIPVSHGCIRMLPDQADEYFEWTEVGTKINIHY